jgi:hypothetical protein
MGLLSDRIVLAIWRDREERKRQEIKRFNAEDTEEAQRTRRIFEMK